MRGIMYVTASSQAYYLPGRPFISLTLCTSWVDLGRYSLCGAGAPISFLGLRLESWPGLRPAFGLSRDPGKEISFGVQPPCGAQP